MRTGWTSSDTYALLDVGPLGHAHQHQDKLNLVFSSYGRPLLWDGGGGAYEDSKWRTYALSSNNHNTAIIDDLGQNRDQSVDGGMGSGNPNTPVPVWKTTDDFDYIQGTYMDGYGTIKNTIATHHREVFFLKSFNVPAFIVVDRFLPNNTDSHKYTVIWNFKTTNSTLDTKYKMLYSVDPQQGNVAILPLANVGSTNVTKHVGEDGNLLWGWDISRDAPYYIPATTVLHERTAAGVQYLVTLMLALPPSTPFSSANISSISSNGNSYSVSFANAPEIDIVLNSDATVGGMQVTVANSTYTSPNYPSATSSTGPGATSSSSESTSSPTTSGSTTGEHANVAGRAQVSLVCALMLLALAVLL